MTESCDGRHGVHILVGTMGTRSAKLNAFSLGELIGDDDDNVVAPKELRLFRKGINETEKGDFLFDEEAAKLIMAFFENKGHKVSFDFEHQALETPAVIAPAAGWFKLEIRNGDLFAVDIRWTARARSMIEAREYRFFSPAFEFDKESGRLTRLINVALTNNPAMDRIEPLVAATATGDKKMADHDDEKDEELRSLKRLVARLQVDADDKDKELKALKAKLQEEDDEDQEEEEEEMSVALSVSKRSTHKDRIGVVTGLASLRASVRELTGEDTDAKALGKLTAWQTDAKDVVALKASSAKIEKETLTTRVKDILDKAATDGKVPPASREQFEVMTLKVSGGKDYSVDGVDFLKSHVEALSVVNSNAATPDGSVHGEKMTSSMVGILKNLGINQAKFAADQAKQRAAQ